ncbi:hypothetical protein [Acinetobacter pittii]|uniref:hypothetical protein n=1 Tax=Acinetobacter pittii TaxID=48296 RepID=UPI0005C55975|nr:hypothetical protein [Acinetobacter pittii]WGM23507.1 hypothetical protein OFU58_12480 [Acinetobacter pittii]
MNENAELIKYLDIAEIVYLNINEKFQTTNSQVVKLDLIMSEIVKEAKSNNLKLRYMTIDFEDCLSKPISEREIKVDLSLLPHFQYRDEFILWLTKFIGNISVPKKVVRRSI